MTEPIESEYDETPLAEPEEGEGEEETTEDNGRDLAYMVPETEVAWDELPSFNDDPSDLSEDSGDGDQDENSDPSADFKMDLSTLRTAETSILAEANGAVDKYEEVRALVASVKDTVFGQGATSKGDGGSGHTSLSAGYNPSADKETKNPFAEAGEAFGAEMNPAQERALLQVASSLNKLGEYIARLNHSGQVYAQADRQSHFPDPPPTT
ncbi:hypothetical protein JGS22_023000 [Streptomyces sp. P38-E01]|uniref:Uncharacterized protein n=1 Tax=Streptomyces tardus TaxID=2780544 RepID=A0A949JKG3_9ACTN|nr:hypothetical protein [Streptomyces tardus]MBU7600419.1 hypothetical protein [Streptomyces tardus]